MDFQVTTTTVLDWSGDALALGLFESDVTEAGAPGEAYVALDQRLNGALGDLLSETEFKGKPGSSASLRIGRDTPVRKLIVVGLGKADALKLDTLRRAAAAAAKLARQQRCVSLGLGFPLGLGEAVTAQACMEGAELVLYKDMRFKSEETKAEGEEAKPNLPETVALLGLSAAQLPEAQGAIAQTQQILSGVILARQLVAAPPNSLTPLTMAATAEQMAVDYGLQLKILEKDECEALGMGAFLGVAQASDLPPKFIHLTYTPPGTPRKKLAIVGKGLTFDSGGLNIKGAGSGIETMKMDMGGAAATLGAAQAIAQLKPDVEVHFITAVTENMISGRAMRPGDILTASNGKTIEVNNTDAEGRLTLADALVYADKLGVDGIIDLATLTGACVIALGNDIAGLFTPNDELATSLGTAAEQAGEKIWRMPMEEKYFEGIKSPIADMKNTGPRGGGSITAALFLKEFVKDTPAWAHLDIAGPVWADKEQGYIPSGATGYGVRLLVNWVLA